MKILSGPVGIPPKQSIPLTKPVCPSAKRKDEKLLKILNGPVGIPFIKSKPSTTPVSFHFGQSSKTKLSENVNATDENYEKNNTVKQSNWKREIKNLRKENIARHQTEIINSS